MSKIDEILQKGKSDNGDVLVAPESEALKESEFFGLWKGSTEDSDRRFIDLQARDGWRFCYDYPDRKVVTYNPQLPAVHIEFFHDLVTITGRNIEPIYELLMKQKIAWVREADKRDSDDGKTPCFVEDIIITPKTDGGEASEKSDEDKND